jgi:hypothetical protein
LKKKQSAKTKSQRRRTLLKKYGVSRSWLLSKKGSKLQTQLTDYLKSIFPQYTILSDFPIDRYKIDILFKELNLVVEFNGTYWHCDPRFYEKNYSNKKKRLYAENIWDYDYERKTFLENLGYKVIIVWEYDYKNDYEQTLSLLKESIDG